MHPWVDKFMAGFGYAKVAAASGTGGNYAADAASERDSRPGNRIAVEGYDDETGLLYQSTVGGEHYLGLCANARPMPGGGESEYTKLVAALSAPLPAGSYIQVGTLAAPDIEPVTGAYLDRKTGADGVLWRLAKQRHDFFQEGVNQSHLGNGVLLRKLELIVSVKVPCSVRPSPEEKRVAAETIGRVIDGLSTVGLGLSVMSHNEYVGLLTRITHLYSKESRSPEISDVELLRDQVFAPGEEVFYDNEIITFHEGAPDAYVAKGMSVKQYPKQCEFGLANLLIGDSLGTPNQIASPFWLVMTLHYPDQVDKKNWLRSRYAWITQQCVGQTSNLFPLLWEKKAGFDTLIQEVEVQAGIVVDTNLTLWVFDRDKRAVERSMSSLRSYFSSIGFEMRADKRIMRLLWNETLPMNTSRSGTAGWSRDRTMSVRQASWVLPIFGEWPGTRSATSIFSTRRGEAVCWSPWDSNAGFNIVAFAATRGGKSFLIQLLLSDNVAEGVKAWIIDFGMSYRKIVVALGDNGQELDFREDSQTCLNPFTHITSIDDEMDVLLAVISTMSAPEHGLDEFQMSALEQAIKAAWNHYGPSATITTVYEQCVKHPEIRVRDIGQMLYPFSKDGSYGHWFEGENNLNMDARVTLLELQSLKSRPTLQKVVFLQLFARIAQEMFLSLNERKMLIIDEAHELLDNPVMAKAIESMYRKVAKAKGCVALITQGIGDLYNSPNGRAIYANSAWSLVLQQKSESIDAAIESKNFAMDPYGVMMMKSLHVQPGIYADVMIQGGQGWGVVRFAVDPWMHELFSTTGENREEAFDLMKQGMAVEDIIDGMMQQRAA
ncbi:MAG: type IV secretion system protein TraC [Rhodocyclaceae bacterium]|nr:MAG: type IV secretion system protein TraC [Rhodocyclaceae bacterium]